MFKGQKIFDSKQHDLVKCYRVKWEHKGSAADGIYRKNGAVNVGFFFTSECLSASVPPQKRQVGGHTAAANHPAYLFPGQLCCRHGCPGNR